MSIISPKVSIIIPVYNTAQYLAQCIDSVINQTLKEIEIILIDDCSTDGSEIICDDYAKKDNRVKVIHNKTNIKQGKCRNIGIELATGEYLGFVDSDDWVDVDFYEKLFTEAKKVRADIAKGGCKKLPTDGNIKINDYLLCKIKKGIENGEPLFTVFTYEHWAAIYKKTLITKYNLNYPDIRNGEDTVFLLSATYYAKSFVLVDNTFYCYRIHPNSITNTKILPYYESTIEAFYLYITFLNTHKMEREHYEKAFHWRLNASINHIFANETNEALKKHLSHYTIEILKLYGMHKYDPLLLIRKYRSASRLEAKIKTYEAKIKTYEAKIKTYEAKIKTYEAKIKTYERSVIHRSLEKIKTPTPKTDKAN